MVKGIVVQFRRGRHRIHEKHFLLDIGLSSREEAKKMAGKEAVWKSPAGKEIKGRISDAHGNNGVVRAIFEKGLPGQAITTEIEIKGELPKTENKAEHKKEEKTEQKKEAKNKEDKKEHKEK